MGAAVSGWRLANAVSRTGQMGVVSGTALDTVFVRRLQDGDPGGHMRRGMEQFPIQRAADEAAHRYHRPNGLQPGEPYKMLPLYRQVMASARQELTMLAAFVEVFLAKEGHDAPVGINLLTKIQPPTLATLYGAMLAGGDYVLMGAGIPREIAGVLDLLAGHQLARIRFDVEGLPSDAIEYLEFDPGVHWETLPKPLARPKFLPIVASNSLATMLARKATGRVDGFVIEGPTAGGHNAPPRGEPRLNERGEPMYGERDKVDLAKVRDLGLPFWVAGGAGHPERLIAARAAGAAGIQVRRTPPSAQRASGSATWGICASPSWGWTERSTTGVPVSQRRRTSRRAAGWKTRSVANAYATRCLPPSVTRRPVPTERSSRQSSPAVTTSRSLAAF